MLGGKKQLEKENSELKDEIAKLKEEIKRIHLSRTAERTQRESAELYSEVIKIVGALGSIEDMSNRLCELFLRVFNADSVMILENNPPEIRRFIRVKNGSKTASACPVCSDEHNSQDVLELNRKCITIQLLNLPGSETGGFLNEKKTFFTNNFARTKDEIRKNFLPSQINTDSFSDTYQSIIITPIQISGEISGAIHIAAVKQGHFNKINVTDIENIAGSIAASFQRIRSKQNLEHFQETYRGIVENIRDGILLLNSSGVVEYCNQLVAKWLDIPVNEVLGKPGIELLEAFLPPERDTEAIRNSFKKEFDTLISTGDSHWLNKASVVRVLNKSGEMIRLEQKVIRLTFGSKRYFLAIFHDVTKLMSESDKLQVMATEMETTIDRLQRINEELNLAKVAGTNLLEDLNAEINERREIQAELLKSKEYFKKLIENSRDIIAVIDPRGKKLYESDSVEHTLGYRPEEIVGKYSAEFIHPSDIEKLQKPITELIQTPRGRLEINFSMRHKDGSYRLMEGTFMNLLDDPAVNGIVINYRDVTEKKTAEDMIRHSQSLLSSLLKNAPVMIFIVSTDDKFEIVNSAWEQFFGHKLDEIKGKHISSVLPKSLVDDFANTNRQVLNERSTILYERTIKTNKGDRHFNFFKFPVFVDGILTSIGGMAIDVTQAKVASEKVVKLSRAIDQSPVSVIITDIEGTIEYVNPKFTQVSGYSLEEIIGKNPRILNSGVQNRFVYADLWETIKSGHNWTGELCNKKRDGELYWEQVNISPLKSDDGKITHFIAVKEDISEKRNMIETLNDTRKRINFISEAASASLYYLKFEDMKFEFIGPAITKITGYTQNELNQMGLNKIIKIFESQNNSDFSIISIYDNIEEVKDKEYKADYLIRTKDGIDKWLAEDSYPWYDKSGILIGRLGLIRDITTRKASEEELLLEKLRLEQLIKNSPVGIITLDANSNILNVNEGFTKIFLYTKEELIGKNPDELILPDEDIQTGREISDSVIKGNSTILEAYRKKKDGTLVFVRIIGLPIIVRGKVTGIYGLYDDLSDLKKAEEDMKIAKERAEEINRLKSTFLANMSHELRTPLVGILGFAEMLADSTDEEARGHGEVIFSSGKRLLETLNLILDLSKLEAEKISIIYENADVNQVVQSVIKLFTPNAEKKGLYLKAGFDIDPLYADFDPHLLRDSITNLLNNALKFTVQGGVTITTGLSGHDFFVRVRDTGIGIEKDKFDLIFEEFRQASEGTSRVFEGTGLGLTITRNYINKMNGRITVDSSVGAGTSFTIYLPVKKK